jgi:hypothetical protein
MPWLYRVGRFALVLCTLAGLAATFAASAWASGYWNVWQANLPNPNGVRSAHTVYGGGPGGAWQIRLSWTSGTHDMNFSWIANNGSWTNLSAFMVGGEYAPGSTYDRWAGYTPNFVTSGVAQAGCQNPSGLSTVFTNCRNAENI